MTKTSSIMVASIKGGVGKTTVAVNLAVALSIAGYKTLLYEMDTVNPGVSYHLGKLDDESSVQVYKPTGLQYSPARVSESYGATEQERASQLESEIKSGNYDFVVIDTQSADKSLLKRHFDMGLIIINPDEQSCAAGIMAKDLLESSGAKCNIMLNRGFEKPYALSDREIEEMFGTPIMAKAEEDLSLRKSLLEHVPNIITENAPKFNSQISNLARVYAAMIDEDYAQKFENFGKELNRAKSEIKKLQR
ncbi:AAA family ATPase [Candidatus Marsarchaeota archaeon]|nr:AAA family ATPase [Candidatus Marsarchaeota archaeon]